MNCHFCQQQAHSVWILPDSKTFEIEVWECNNHLPVIFRFSVYRDGKYKHQGLFLIPLKDRWYGIEWDAPYGSANIAEYTRSVKDDRKFNFKQPVILFTKGITLTPENAVNKLKTILAFL